MPADDQKARPRQVRPRPGEAEAPDPPRRTEFLTAQQLAEVLQVSESTVHRLRRAGRIPAVLVTERLIRFNLRDVQRALRPASARPTADGAAGETAREPDPQLSFDDLFADFNS